VPDSDRSITDRNAPLWHQWLLFAFIWGGIIVFKGTLNMATYLGVAGEGVLLAVVAIFYVALLVGMLVIPSALTAALLRGLWLRFAPRSVKYADLPAILTGALAAPLGLLAFYSTGDLSVWLSPGDTLEPFWPTMLINGSVAGLLAHRRMSLRDPRWWLLVAGSVVLGLVCLAILEPTFRPIATG
jgi:hypothetical protein